MSRIMPSRRIRSLVWLLLSLSCLGGADNPVVTPLIPSLAEIGSVEAKDYAYYEIQGQGPNLDLTIITTPMSGDPDLFLSLASQIPYPTSTNNQWSRAHLGADSLIVPAEDEHNCGAAPDCKYRLGVYGYIDSSFTVVATWNSSLPIGLSLGQPQAGHVTSGTFRQYAFDLEPAAMDAEGGLQIIATPTMGDPDIYVSLGSEERPSAEKYDYRSALWGGTQDRIVIRKDDEVFRQKCPDETCVLRIGVYGFHDADYSLVLSTQLEALALQQGLPMESVLPPWASQHFTMTWPSSLDDVVISLSPQSGQPRLYASCKTPTPDIEHHEWMLGSGVGGRSNVLRINGTEGKHQGCGKGQTLSLSVTSDSLSSFSLMASTDATSSVPLLVPGVQVFGQAKTNRFQYYQIRLGKTYVDVDVIVTVRSGEVDLYISDTYDGRPQYYDEGEGGVFNYTIKSANDGDDRLSIKHSHFDTCEDLEGCYYIVGVFGRNYAINEFSIVAKMTESTITLQDGLAIRDVVGPRMYEYFKIKVIDPEADLTISATPFTGDPDIYVDMPPNSHPTNKNHTWAARGFGADSLTIQSDSIKQYCVPNPLFGIGCDVYVGVFGWTNTSFSILASLNTGWTNPIVLLSGQPQSGQVDEGNYQYYQFYIPSDTRSPTVHVSLTPEDDSDQDMYVSMSHDKEPGKDSFDLKATSWEDDDTILLSPDQSALYCTDCMLYIAVYGYEEGTYSIRVTLSTDQQALQMGVPSRTTLAANSFMYYSVDWQTAVDDVVLTLTSESGLPHLYASCKDPFPNASAHSWDINTRNNQLLHLTGADAEREGCQLPTKLWVSVCAASMSSFSLMASLDASSTVPILVPGVQVAGSVKQNVFNYYQIRLGKSYVDADVSVTCRTGEVDLYVSTSYEGRPQYNPTQGVFNYTLMSDAWGDDSIHIEHSHFRSCETEGCYYVVGVLGKSSGRNQYTIVAKTAEGVITLRDGIALKDTVGAHVYEYYKIKVVDPEVDLTISVTPFTGDPDLVVSVPPNFHPTKDNHTWISRSFGSDSITIQSDAMKEYCVPDPLLGRGCDYYIGVYGWTNTSFSIQASLNSGWASPMMLFSGQPQSGIVKKGSYQYYEYYVPDETEKIRFVLTPTDGADQDLYLSVSREKEPGKEAFDMSSTTWAGADEITFNQDEAGDRFCQDCMVYLAVYGYMEGEFTLSAETSGLSTLQNAIPITGHVITGGAAYYMLYNGNPEAHIIISVTTLAGDADIYVMQSTTEDGQLVLPGKDRFQWKSNRVGDDVVEINPSNAHFCFNCDYIIGVTGWSNTSFTLTGVVEDFSIIPLAAGRPQTSHVGPLSMKYFSAVLGNSAEDLRVKLTQLSGRAKLFISENLEPGYLPTPEIADSYKYRSSHNGEIVIPGPHLNRTTFAIGVYGMEDSDFSIMASFSQTPVMLQEGVPLQQSVSAGRTEYFLYRLTNAEDVTVTVTSLQGDPDVMASTVHDKPSCYQPDDEGAWSYECGNYTWISQSFASDQLTILHDLPCEEVRNTRVDASCTPDMVAPGKLLHIGVYGYDDAVFTISLTTGGGHTSLIPGQPQHAITQTGAICETRSASGACDTSAGGWSKAQVAYFKFRVSPNDLGADGHVSVVLEPLCNTTVTTPCAPGCSCNPLTVYLTSCKESECGVKEAYPSSLQGHYQLKHVAQGPYSTLFIAHDPLNPDNGFCDPKAKGGEVCFYYLTVMHPEAESPPAAFTITASTPSDVTILPTRTHPSPPDGIIFSNLDAVDSSLTGAKKYQMYAEKGSSVLMTLEACTGDVSLSVCDGSCSGLYPTETDFRYYADETKTCTKAGCQASTSRVPRIGLDNVADHSYFLSINGTGIFFLKVDTTEPATGVSIAPLLVPPDGSPVPILKEVQEDRVTLSWKPVTLTVPGKGGKVVQPQKARYKIFALEDEALQKAISDAKLPTANKALSPALHTVCGLEHYASITTATSGTKVALTDEGATSYTMGGLSPGTQYRFIVMALCDASCLRQVSHTSLLNLPCGGALPCQDQTALYAPAHMSTISPSSSHNPSSYHSSRFSLTIAFLMLGLVITVVTVGLLYRKNRRLEQQLQYEMTDTSNFTASTVSSSSSSRPHPPPSRPSGADKKYEPLLADDEVDDNYMRMMSPTPGETSSMV